MTVIEVPEESLASAAPVVVAPPSTSSPGRIAYRVGRALLSGLVTVVVVLGAWILFLKAFHVSSFIGKGPLDVWRYVFTQSGAGANRHHLIDESGTTLRDAFLGLAAGTVAAVACAISFNLWSAAASAFMPLAMVLRSVPLVAMTPLIVGIFGRNLMAITIISGIVTFFPTLVNVTLALKRTPKESLDLCRAYGASSAGMLWKVQIPNALPSLFASLRIAAPLSLVGALLAEWLATGQGLGYKILDAAAVSDYTGLWARVVLITLYSALLYTLIGVVEKVVLARFGSVAR
jgi:ABC-type nitrate/sulfonate/bicarbonate transport system permease component